MKQSDAIRLTLAYALIAVSARDTKAKSPAPRESHADKAATPVDVAPRQWFEVMQAVVTKMGKNRVIAVAAGLTFYSLLAIFPGVTALVSIYGLFADPVSIKDHMAELSGFIPEGALSAVGDQIQRITEQGGKALSFAFISGLAVALWSANSGVKALFDALNIAYIPRKPAVSSV